MPQLGDGTACSVGTASCERHGRGDSGCNSLTLPCLARASRGWQPQRCAPRISRRQHCRPLRGAAHPGLRAPAEHKEALRSNPAIPNHHGHGVFVAPNRRGEKKPEKGNKQRKTKRNKHHSIRAGFDFPSQSRHCALLPFSDPKRCWGVSFPLCVNLHPHRGSCAVPP